jgi:glycosyltransferase involved in cell wall biosynthesis
MANKIAIGFFVWNGEKTIKDAVMSIINQTYKNIDIIILDNQSEDFTVNIVRKIKNKYPKKNIKIIIDKKKRNLPSACRFLVKKYLKNYEYSVVLNDDDIIHPEFIELAFKRITKYNLDLVYSSFNFIDMNNKIFKPNKISLNYKFAKYPIYTRFNSNLSNLIIFIFFKNIVPIILGLFRTKSLLQSINHFRYFDKSRSNYDTSFLVHFYILNKIDQIKKVLLSYRIKDRIKIYKMRKNPEVKIYSGFFSNFKIIFYQLILSRLISRTILLSNYISYWKKIVLLIFVILNYFWIINIYILKIIMSIIKMPLGILKH